MKNAVPLSTIANTYNISIHELLRLVGSMKLRLTYVENIAFVNARDFDFLITADEIFINTCAIEGDPAQSGRGQIL